MLFGKKNKEVKCSNCNSSLNDKFNFCPYCGGSLRDERKEMKEFGMLGRDDFPRAKDIQPNLQNFGITDKLINSIMNSMMKSFDNIQNVKDVNQENAKIEQLPNGIKISIGVPQQIKQRKEKTQIAKKEITEEQMKKLSSLPRTSAKSKIKRLSDKVVYELAVSGIESPNDIFVSKLENGYEIKAIGKKKIYTNSIPIDLPLRGFSLSDNKLLVEFKTEK
jgi:hypothetical protein